MAGTDDTISMADTLIDLRRDNIEDAEAQVDASAYALAAVFGPVSWPPGMPDYRKEAIRERAEQMRNADGTFHIDSRMKPTEHGDADDENDNISQFAQIVRQEQAEREEWLHTRSSVCGVTMTGEEWADFAKRLREDDKLHEDILAAFMRRGMDKDEAERRYERVVDVAEIAAIPESQRSEAQQQTFEKAKADPTFSTDMKEAEARWQAKVAPTPSPVPDAAPVERQVVALDGPAV